MAQINKGGRPRGSKNKLNKDFKDYIKTMVVGYFSSDLFRDDLQCLTPRERSDVMTKIRAYFQPKLKSLDLDINGDEVKKESFEDQLKRLAEEFDV